MRTTRVKICGLKHPDDVRCARDAGADYLGFIFAKAARRVDLHELDRWLGELRGDAEVVGVFRNQSFAEVTETVERYDLDLVQLHGDEHGESWARLPVRMIEARIVSGDGLPSSRFAGAAWAQLLDGGAGEGKVFDWGLARDELRRHRVFLAGGLSPQNVGEAIASLRPFAVDVSSGVEIEPGRKDHDRLRSFLAVVRETDRR